MDYAKIASQVIEHVGGKQNIKSVQHCATRLRLQLKDNDLRNEDAVSDIEGVKGVFLTQSQFQIIFGSGLVNLVCDEVQKQLGISVDTSADDEKEEKKGNVLQRLVKLLSDIFVPIIPAIVAGGLLMGEVTLSYPKMNLMQDSTIQLRLSEMKILKAKLILIIILEEAIPVM